jgi:hypothetical protein
MAVIDINNLKEQVQTILDAANTTTASTDLSNGLLTRVQKVLKVNPGRIPIQASYYPFVTVYVSGKEIEHQDMAVNQSNSKRRANIEVRIAGAVWNNVFVNNDVDDADDDCESLMENVEQIIRDNSTLNSAALWTIAKSVEYHTANVDSGVNIRAGVLRLNAVIFY